MYDPMGVNTSKLTDEEVLNRLNQLRQLRSTQAGGRFQMVTDQLEYMIETLEREYTERYQRTITSDRNRKAPPPRSLNIGEIDPN